MLERGGGELPLKLVRIERDALPAAAFAGGWR